MATSLLNNHVLLTKVALLQLSQVVLPKVTLSTSCTVGTYLAFPKWKRLRHTALLSAEFGSRFVLFSPHVSRIQAPATSG